MEHNQCDIRKYKIQTLDLNKSKNNFKQTTEIVLSIFSINIKYSINSNRLVIFFLYFFDTQSDIEVTHNWHISSFDQYCNNTGWKNVPQLLGTDCNCLEQDNAKSAFCLCSVGRLSPKANFWICNFWLFESIYNLIYPATYLKIKRYNLLLTRSSTKIILKESNIRSCRIPSLAHKGIWDFFTERIRFLSLWFCKCRSHKKF